MRKIIFLLSLIACLSFKGEWGFFGHKLINEMAIYTLPAELSPFYKKYFDYIKNEAVGPDMRRYASKFEAPRHYIDLDAWGSFPFDNLPRNWVDALIQHTDIKIIDVSGKSHLLSDNQQFINEKNTKLYRQFFIHNILNHYYDDPWEIDCSVVKNHFRLENIDCQSAIVIDTLSIEGIVPWHLQFAQKKLTKAMRDGELKAILRHSADLGHYVADAHVPLHTTRNYNGQLTNQKGIHAFWESRLPELFAYSSYDFLVGPAEYIEDKETYFWNIVFESHRLVADVLQIEKELSRTFPADQQYCFEERGSSLVETPCPAYANAFHEKMNGMVENRMREAIHSVGNAWFTAWVDAGRPDLMNISTESIDLKEDEAFKKAQAAYQKGEIKGRSHGQ